MGMTTEQVMATHAKMVALAMNLRDMTEQLSALIDDLGYPEVLVLADIVEANGYTISSACDILDDLAEAV